MDMEMNMRANLDADTSRAERKLDEFASKAEKTRGIADNSMQPPPFQQKKSELPDNQVQAQLQSENLEKTSIANDALGSFIENFKVLNELMPAFSDTLRKITHETNAAPASSKGNSDNDIKGITPKWLEILQKYGATVATASLAGLFEYNASQTRRRTRALDADVFGMEQESIQGKKGVVNTVTSFLPVLGATIGGGLAAAGTFGVGTAVGAGVGAGAGSAIKGAVDTAFGAGLNSESAKISEQERMAQIYQQKLPDLEKSLVYFGKPSVNSITNRYTMEKLNTFWTEKARNTGISTEDFVSLANSLAQYGITPKERAGNIAHEAATMARYTGTDVDAVLDFMGGRARFGSKDTQKDVERAYAYSQASGLGKGQFGEFLDGLQGAVEQGIAKGYTASTEDISKQMLMFSKLSGGDETWEGKYGFQKLSQINNGLSGATSLSTSSQILAYQAMRGIVGQADKDGKVLKGGAYLEGQDVLNTLSLMEAGLNVNSFKAIASAMSNTYGNDALSQVAAWKELSGLNYTGAMKLYQMANSGELDNLSPDEIQGKLNELDDKEFQTDTANIMNSVNEIKDDVNRMSEKGLKVYLEKLEDLKETQKGEREKAVVENIQSDDSINRFLEENFNITGADDKYYKNLKKALAGDGIGYLFGETKSTGKAISETYKEIYKDGIVDKEERLQMMNLLKKLADALNNLNVVVTTR
jgi:hypothetical protein